MYNIYLTWGSPDPTIKSLDNLLSFHIYIKDSVILHITVND